MFAMRRVVWAVVALLAAGCTTYVTVEPTTTTTPTRPLCQGTGGCRNGDPCEMDNDRVPCKNGKVDYGAPIA